jgi:DNA-3-methyladenine glycosylase
MVLSVPYNVGVEQAANNRTRVLPGLTEVRRRAACFARVYGKTIAMSTKAPRRLKRAELPKKTIALARYLIGKTLVHESGGARLAGRIVETEAYLVGDAAAHSFRGETPRNRSLFLERGHAYVYFIYGNHFMLNVASGAHGTGEGVLLRAAEPLEGIEQMRLSRGVDRLRDLARGPGRLAEAFAIDSTLDGVDFCGGASPLWFGSAVRPVGTIGTSVRIGITKEVHRPLRFYERGNEFVSGTKASWK